MTNYCANIVVYKTYKNICFICVAFIFFIFSADFSTLGVACSGSGGVVLYGAGGMVVEVGWWSMMEGWGAVVFPFYHGGLPGKEKKFTISTVSM